jgi:uncharacterized protein YoxC
MDYTKLTIAELANGVNKTETAIRRCREILDDLQEPKTAGMQAVVKAIRDLLPKLEEDLKALEKAYNATNPRIGSQWDRCGACTSSSQSKRTDAPRAGIRMCSLLMLKD